MKGAGRNRPARFVHGWMALQRDTEHQVHARIARIAQVIHAIDLDHINVLRVEPVARPRALKPEPIAAVLEAVIAVIACAQAKGMVASNIGFVAVGGNAAAACVFFLLLVPGLLGMLFLPILLFWPSTFLFLPRVFLIRLRGLFWLCLLLFFLRRLVFVFFLLVVLLLLCVHRNADSEGQGENCCAESSYEFHKVLPPSSNRDADCCLT